MALFGDEPSEGKAVVPETEEPGFVFDARTKTEGNGAEENGAVTKTAEELAEEQRLKDEADLAAGKTPELIAEEKRLAEEAAAGKTPEQIKAEEDAKKANDAQLAAAEEIRQEARKELLKSFGVETEEELQAKLHPKKELSPEEKEHQQNIYEADLANYMIKQKAFTNSELVDYHNIVKMPDDVLVFQEFANTYKEANKDRKDADGKADPVSDDELKDKFNELYHNDSENESLKTLGQKNIELKAKALRAPLEEKYNDVKSIYDNEMAEKQAVPAFKDFFSGTIDKAIPAKLEFGEGDDKFTFDLSTLDRAALEKKMLAEYGVSEFKDFLAGKGDPKQRERLTEAVMKEVLYMNHKELVKEAIKNGVSAGKKLGAKGSDVSFVEPGKQDQPTKVTTKVTPEENRQVASDFAI